MNREWLMILPEPVHAGRAQEQKQNPCRSGRESSIFNTLILLNQAERLPKAAAYFI
jgi:hypothetical protein